MNEQFEKWWAENAEWISKEPGKSIARIAFIAGHQAARYEALKNKCERINKQNQQAMKEHEHRQSYISHPF